MATTVTPSFPGPIPKDALAFLESKGIRPSFGWAEVYAEEHAFAFAAAKAMSNDVLRTLHDAVTKALAQGQTLKQFRTDLTPRLQKLGWWGQTEAVDPLTGKVRKVQLGSPRRLELIFDANMRTARAAGQWQRIQRTKEFLPYLLYELGPAEHHRPLHVAWSGTLLPADDPWWVSHFPPNGWRCHCHVRQVDERETKRRGGVTARPDDGYVDWTNPRTGEVKQVPRGIDPGWESNPGMVRSTAPNVPPAAPPLPPAPPPPSATPTALPQPAPSIPTPPVPPPAKPSTVGGFATRTADLLGERHGTTVDVAEVKGDAILKAGRLGERDPVSGKIRVVKSEGDALETMMATGKPTEAASSAVVTLVHENLHALGPWKRIVAPGYDEGRLKLDLVSPDWAVRKAAREELLRVEALVAKNDLFQTYQTGWGLALEEGAVELSAVRSWREIAREQGLVFPEAMGQGREYDGGRLVKANHVYLNEVAFVERVCRMGAGEDGPGPVASAASEKMLEGLLHEWKPSERPARIAEAIVEKGAASDPGELKARKVKAIEALIKALPATAKHPLSEAISMIERTLAATKVDVQRASWHLEG